jgi:hypothetical protein
MQAGFAERPTVPRCVHAEMDYASPSHNEWLAHNNSATRSAATAMTNATTDTMSGTVTTG